MLNDEIYGIILEEYKESGWELFDEMFLTQFNYIGGYQYIGDKLSYSRPSKLFL
jgi:hypothetical protein